MSELENVEPVVEDGTPEPVAPEGEPAVAEPVAPEPAPTTEEFYQTKYQELKSSHDDALAQLNDLGYGDSYKQPDPEPQAVAPEAPKDDLYVDESITKADLQSMIQKASAEGYRQAQQSATQRQEYASSRKIMESFIQTNQVPNTHVQEAVAFAESLNMDENRPGVPQALAKVVLTQLQSYAVRDKFNSKVTQAGAEATSAAKAAQLVQQPDAGAMPEPGDLTQEEKDIQAMKSLTDNTARDEFFG
jgi:hypothetical protein